MPRDPSLPRPNGIDTIDGVDDVGLSSAPEL